LVISVIWRLPSLWDPPWVNDEGTYFAVAQAMRHGYRLYADVWENKPPLLYLVYEAVDRVAGPSLLAVRLLALVASLSLVALTFLLSRRYVNNQSSLAAALLSGLLLSVPFLEGTTANAEIFLALFAASGVYFVLVRNRPLMAGLLLGLAILVKTVAIFDATAIAVWLIGRRRTPYAYCAGVLLPPAACVVLAAFAGILPAMLHHAVLYDLGYVRNGNGGGVPLLLVAKLATMVALTALTWRAPFPYLWLLYTAAGALVSGRIFGHYMIQALVPFVLVLALHLPERLARRPLLRLPALFASMACLCALVGWILAIAGHDSILARRLQYYADFGRLALGTQSYGDYSAEIDDHVNRNLAVASLLKTLPPGRLLVWGNSPWIYVLSTKLPATPYTSSLRSPKVPGETAALRGAVARCAARELVVVDAPAPPLGSANAAITSHYRSSGRIKNATIYVSAC